MGQRGRAKVIAGDDEQNDAECGGGEGWNQTIQEDKGGVGESEEEEEVGS